MRRQWYRGRWAELLRIEDVEFHAVGHDHVAGLLVRCAWADAFGSHGEGPADVSQALALRSGHKLTRPCTGRPSRINGIVIGFPGAISKMLDARLAP